MNRELAKMEQKNQRAVMVVMISIDSSCQVWSTGPPMASAARNTFQSWVSVRVEYRIDSHVSVHYANGICKTI